MDIRIGNDIEIQAVITNLDSYPKHAIKSIECILQRVDDNCHHDHFNESYPQFYCPSRYTMHCCGAHCYHVVPQYSKVLYGCATPFVFHDYHYWPQYCGFGINSKKFHHCDCGKGDYFRLPCKHQESSNIITCYFASCHQYECGEYRFKINVVVKEEGYGLNNQHSYTFDYGTIFNIKCNECADSGNTVCDLSDKECEIKQYNGSVNPNEEIMCMYWGSYKTDWKDVFKESNKKTINSSLNGEVKVKIENNEDHMAIALPETLDLLEILWFEFSYAGLHTYDNKVFNVYVTENTYDKGEWELDYELKYK